MINTIKTGRTIDAAALEALIVKVAGGEVPRADLLTLLASAKVALMLDKGLENGMLANDCRPFSLKADQGFFVLAAFSSVAKAAPWVQREPVFANVLYTDFEWAIRMIPANAGLAIDPGYKRSLLIPPDELRTLVQGPEAT